MDVNVHTLGESLLYGLARFMQPMLPFATGGNRGEIDARISLACKGTAGHALLAAFNEFTLAVVAGFAESEDIGSTKMDEDKTTPHDISIKSSASIWAEHDQHMQGDPLTAVNHNHRLMSSLRPLVYNYVFTKMPIRLLAFDKYGSHIRLLDRRSVAEIVVDRAYRSMLQSEDWELLLSYWDNVAPTYARYAILSHTWIREDPGDVVYGDWVSETYSRTSPGYAKIMNLCRVAAQEYDDISFAWMDTVCIDKTSSAELDESIRSMYRWYKGAYVCVTYLAETLEVSQMHLDPWFTRGWTLQELLAPKNVKFYNKDWLLLVPSPHLSEAVNDPAFTPEISELTEFLAKDHLSQVKEEIPIPLYYQIWKATTLSREELLLAQYESSFLPMSRVLQLAAVRQVTREEDAVYSLMGLLDVGLSIAYGEGKGSALNRLFQQIMISKPDFMDLFNHGNPLRLLPFDLDSYKTRTKTFDGSGRYHLMPDDLTIATHRGVQISFLFISAFSKPEYLSKISPQSTFSEVKTLTSVNIILDNSQDSADWISSVFVESDDNIIFFGIVNFKSDAIGIWIPQKCLAMPMKCFATGTVETLYSKEFQRSGQPVVISLPFRRSLNSEQGYYYLSMSEAGKLGIRVTREYVY